MRLRSVVLMSVVVLASGGAAFEFAARSAAKRLARELAPSVSLTYESAGIGLDGSIRLGSPRLQFKHEQWKGNLRARVANLRGPGRLWLLSQALSADPQWPADMTLTTRGLSIVESQDLLVSNWVSLPDLAIFENVGCGSDALSSKDRERMGLHASERIDTIGYRFEESSRRLELSMTLNSEDISRWTGAAEFSAFDPAHLSQSTSRQAVRLNRATLSYQDQGYLSRRNKFCAEWLGITPAQFVDRHVAAVRTFLATRGIEPSEDVLGLYQRLVNRGGALNLASLPDAAWVPAETDAYPREVLLRLLNITVRIDDAPPTMLRLAFTDPEQPLYGVTSDLPDPALVSALPDDGSIQSPSMATPQPASPAPEAAPLAATAVAEKSAGVVPAGTGMGKPDEVREGKRASVPEDDGSRLPDKPKSIASAPPPPENSTLALVWKPGQIERLPPAEAKIPDHDVISVSSLGSFIGKRVQLHTTGGKRVDGEIQSVDSGNLVLLVQVGRGDAKLNVPLANIREARLIRPRPTGSK